MTSASIPHASAKFEFGSKNSTPRMTSEVEPILDVELTDKINEFEDE